jgi:hypothetical protein
MHTLRRILKYTLTWLVCLLGVAWSASLQNRLELDVGSFGVEFSNASVSLSWLKRARDNPGPPQMRWQHFRHGRPPLSADWDSFHTERSAAEPMTYWQGQVPLPCLVTVLIPISVGFQTACRFRLWHYLAYTALVAVELAYYLRWQE